MDAERFDAWLRLLATTPSRRALIGSALGGLLSLPARRAAAAPSAQATPAATPIPAPTVCTNPDRSGLQERTPGDLVAYEELSGSGILHSRPAPAPGESSTSPPVATTRSAPWSAASSSPGPMDRGSLLAR